MDKEIKIQQLKGYIRLCRSHQNQSNWDLVESQIKYIESLIKELEKENNGICKTT